MSDPRSGDRIPPHDLEAEGALLGAMMLDRDVVTDVGDFLRPEHFYFQSHRLVYEAIAALDERGIAVDSITVADELRRRKSFDAAGGGETLLRLMESVTSSAAARHHARIVHDTARLRAVIQASQETLAECYAPVGEVRDVIDRAEQRMFDVNRDATGEAQSIKDLLRATFEQIEERVGRPAGVLTGLDTGFADLNAQLDGLHPGNLIIVAARPSMGKTSFALNLATAAAVKAAKPVLIFSLEVPKEQVCENILCSTALVNAAHMRKGQIDDSDWAKLMEAANRLSNAQILIDDTPALSAMALRAKARRAKARHDVGLIVVDYLQLMTYPGAESRLHEITMISQALKTTARQLNVPVIALSQLNRQVDAREDHRPRMSDLRESGSIEQDADVIIFLYRPAYYKETSGDQDREAEIIVAKHRNGPTGTVKLWFLSEYLRFGDQARTWS